MDNALLKSCVQLSVQSITGEVYLIISRSEGWTLNGGGGGGGASKVNCLQLRGI